MSTLLELPLWQKSIRAVVWRAHSLATRREASTTQIAGSGLGLISCQDSKFVAPWPIDIDAGTDSAGGAGDSGGDSGESDSGHSGQDTNGIDTDCGGSDQDDAGTESAGGAGDGER